MTLPRPFSLRPQFASGLSQTPPAHLAALSPLPQVHQAFQVQQALPLLFFLAVRVSCRGHYLIFPSVAAISFVGFVSSAAASFQTSFREGFCRPRSMALR